MQSKHEREPLRIEFEKSKNKTKNAPAKRIEGIAH